MTNATDQLKLLGQIRKGKYAPAAEADMSEAVKLNRNVQKPTLYALDMYAASHPRLDFHASNGRLCASMACGYDFEDVSVI